MQISNNAPNSIKPATVVVQYCEDGTQRFCSSSFVVTTTETTEHDSVFITEAGLLVGE